MTIIATTERPAVLGSRTAIPWSTVLPLAVVLSFADGFWMTSFRAATGAIERTQEPFAAWLRESTLALPVFVFAVLGALVLALRLFGRAGTPPRALVSTLMVVAGATVAGIGELVVSSAYDYHLQSAGMAMMDSMQGAGVVSSLAQQQQASLVLQLQSVGYGSVALLATNLVLVAWIVALRGGRVKLSVPRARPAPNPTRPQVLAVLLGTALAASAVIHAAVIGEHLSEWPAAGVFFIALAAAELGAAALLVRSGPRPAILLGAAAVSLGPVVLWAYSRTLGIPFGPGAGDPEPVGLADLAAFTLETTALLLALTLLTNTTWLRRPPVPAHIRSLLLTALIAVTTIGLAGSGLPWLNDLPDAASHTSATTTH